VPLRAGAHFGATRHPEAQDHQQRQNCAGSQRYRPQEFGPKAVYVHLRSMMRFYSKRKVTIRLRPLEKAVYALVSSLRRGPVCVVAS